MSRSVLLIGVLLLVLALPAFAQAPGGGAPGGDAGGGGRGGRGMGMGGAMMGQPPVMMVSEGTVYVIYLGQLSAFKADTLELIKTVPLPMPHFMMGGPGGQNAPGNPPAGGPPPAPPG